MFGMKTPRLNIRPPSVAGATKRPMSVGDQAEKPPLAPRLKRGAVKGFKAKAPRVPKMLPVIRGMGGMGGV